MPRMSCKIDLPARPRVRARVPAAALVLLLGGLFTAPAALAQLSGPTAGVTSPVVRPRQDPVVRTPMPPALPGAQASPGGPVERGAVPLDANPTDALFDAVNRGDIASARDALSRGADLNGRNVLGLTPIDLSVDLGRNDITFLLLSMRGTSPASTAANSSATGPATRKPAKPVATAAAA
ncbi:ankyrin repeat domain-containing protein, partial [Rhodovastum sp. RN2-1]